MQTISEFVPNLFANYSNSLETITSIQNNLNNVSNSSSNFMNTLSISKFVNCQKCASEFSVNIFDAFSNLLDYDYDIGNQTPDGKLWNFNHHSEVNDYDATISTMHDLIALLIDKIGTDNFQVIGYYQGIPIYCGIYSSADYDFDEHIEHHYHFGFSLGEESISQGELTLKPLFYGDLYVAKAYSSDVYVGNVYTAHFQVPCIDPEDPWTIIADARFDNHTYENYITTTFDTIVNEIINSYISNDCMVNIIKRAQADGVIARDQVESIIKQYGSTDFIATVQTLLAGTGKFDCTSIVALVGKLYESMGCSHNENSQAYQVYSDPKYITSIIQAVVSIVLYTVAAILTILFRVIGIIISMIVSVIQYITQLIQKNIASTQAEVLDTSLTPIINNPLLTFRMSKTEMRTFLTYRGASNGVTMTEVDTALQEFGCVMIGPSSTGCSPYWLWILPRDYSNDESQYTVQLLVSIAQPIDAGIMELEMNSLAHGNPSIHHHWASMYMNWVPDSTSYNSAYYSGYSDFEYKYLSMTDDNIRRHMYYNIIKALADVFCYSSSNMTQTYGPTGVGLDLFALTNGYSSGAAIPPYVLEPAEWNIDRVIAVLTNSDNSSIISSWTWTKKACFIAQTLNYAIMCGASDVPTWDSLTKLFNYFHTFNIDDVGTELGDPLQVYNTAKFSYLNFGDGKTLARPAVQWPNLSRAALISSLVLSAVTVAAVASIAVVTKIGLRKIAFNKLASRQAVFDEAKTKYDRMQKQIRRNPRYKGYYTDEQIKKITNDYYKANKRLTRAWSTAGKLGLSMYNGFSTGSSNAGSAFSTSLSPLTTFNSDVAGSNPNVPAYEEDNQLDFDATTYIDYTNEFDDIQKAIKGV